MATHPVAASACFHEDADAEPVIVLVGPAEEQSFSLGSKLTISWNYSEGSDVVVELSTDDGKPDTWERLSRVITAAGTTRFEWSIPDDPAYVTDKARIRLFDYNKIMIETVSPGFAIGSSIGLRHAAGTASSRPYLVFTNGTLRLEGALPGKGISRARISTARGRTFQVPVDSRRGSRTSVNLNELESGVYFVTVRQGDRALSRKITHVRH
jgi:hypothetical protein